MTHPQYQPYLQEGSATMKSSPTSPTGSSRTSLCDGEPDLRRILHDGGLQRGGPQQPPAPADSAGGCRAYIESLVAEPIEPDKRFVYYLLGVTGICVIPLTSLLHRPARFPDDAARTGRGEVWYVVRTLGEDRPVRRINAVILSFYSLLDQPLRIL